jgi:acetyl esterase/lipase
MRGTHCKCRSDPDLDQPVLPYLSPMLGDVIKGYFCPPTLLTTGMRDLFFPNLVRAHRARQPAGASRTPETPPK